MRKGGTLYYMFSDHLGSTSITTDSAGNVVSELRYKPWGETRYAGGTTPTQYQFTGQYSHESDFGLLFFNARWYDPSLGRFAQADSIVPGGVEGLDRYAYVNNAPTRFTDPSGHLPIDDECGYQGQDCGSPLPAPPITMSGGGGGGGSVGGSGWGGGTSAPSPTSTPQPSTAPQPRTVPTPEPSGTPAPTTTVVLTSVTETISYMYTEWMEGPYGDDGINIDFTINPLWFSSTGPLEVDVSVGNQPLTVRLNLDYRYIHEIATITTTTTTTVFDQYGNPMSIITNESATQDLAGLYQQEQITILPMNWTIITTGGNMCGTMAIC